MLYYKDLQIWNFKSSYLYLHTAGKEAMTGGVGRFNQAASLAYKALDEDNKERLLGISNTIERTRLMTSAEVKKAGAKTFKNIQQQVRCM